jgi:hypothetical protein
LCQMESPLLLFSPSLAVLPEHCGNEHTQMGHRVKMRPVLLYLLPLVSSLLLEHLPKCIAKHSLVEICWHKNCPCQIRSREVALCHCRVGQVCTRSKPLKSVPERIIPCVPEGVPISMQCRYKPETDELLRSAPLSTLLSCVGFPITTESN